MAVTNLDSVASPVVSQSDNGTSSIQLQHKQAVIARLLKKKKKKNTKTIVNEKVAGNGENQPD